jgi:alkanesulfonate monooxygenase SsuD/methylene tetrahydromethanopterin reductase-like flavin-dependent oxidoreductase (luciferase family)
MSSKVELSPSYLTQFARAHDEAGFDLALVGHHTSKVACSNTQGSTMPVRIVGMIGVTYLIVG